MFRTRHFAAFDYDFESNGQQEYLDLCLRGCRYFGDDFFEEFLATTFIGDKTLNELKLFDAITK